MGRNVDMNPALQRSGCKAAYPPLSAGTLTIVISTREKPLIA
jgi:hypothetical protein